MKYIKSTLAILSLLSNLTLKPAIESYASFKELPKKILVIGDIHACNETPESDLGKLDMKDSEIVFSFIKQLSQLPNPSKFILGNSKLDLAKKESVRQSCGLNDLYFGLAIYAKNNDYSVGSISFCLADNQSLISQNFLDMFTVLDNPYAKDPKTFFDIQDKIKSLLGKVGTVQQFFNETQIRIDQLRETINNKLPSKALHFVKQLFSEIIRYKEIGEKSFTSEEFDQCYVDVFASRFLKTQDLRSMLGPLYLWILPLFDNLLDCNLIIKLIKALKHHNQIVIFTGNNHAINLHNFLKFYGFETECLKGLVEKSEGPAIFNGPRFNRKELTNFLSNFFKEIKPIRKTTNCLVCNKPSTKRCSRCKSAFYCSQECQKKDWIGHKLLCKKN